MGFDAVTGAIGGGDGGGSTGDGNALSGPNHVFVTSTTSSGSLGGLAGADAMCNSLARSANLSGNYVAWLSTSSVNAIDRLAGSRGWVRTDGVPVVDTTVDLAAGHLLNPISLDERMNPTIVTPWTGTAKSGALDAMGSCGDWMTTSGVAATGWSIAGPARFTAQGFRPCTTAEPIYCFEVGHNFPVTPQVTAGNIIFVSTAPYTGVNGLNALDAACMTDAMAAGLPGTYLAALDTTSKSAASRVNGVSASWRRVDGTKVAEAAHLFDGTDLVSFVDQAADGTYDDYQVVSGGSPNAASTNALTCNNWTNVSSSNLASDGIAGVTRSLVFWTNSTTTCNAVPGFLCLQQ
jgi:hypothetical protein